MNYLQIEKSLDLLGVIFGSDIEKVGYRLKSFSAALKKGSNPGSAEEPRIPKVCCCFLLRVAVRCAVFALFT